MKIVVRMTSGLGNQMLQYNFYRFIQEKYPEAIVKADTKWLYRNDPHHGYELPKIFPNISKPEYEVKEAGFFECLRVSGQFQGLSHNHFVEKKWAGLSGKINKVLRKGCMADTFISNMIDDSMGQLSEKYVTDENGNRVTALYDTVMHLDPKKDYYISGYWSYEAFYKDRLERLRDELMIPEPTDDMNKKFLDEINCCNSVSIHMRRGDYLLPENAGRFKLLGKEYYDSAIKYIKERISNPRFFIFSDDIEYAKKVFSDIENTVYVSCNSGFNSYRDMQLMSACQNNIIANSTFSQWAALLNKNKDSIIIYPSSYLYCEDTEEKTLPGWVRI